MNVRIFVLAVLVAGAVGCGGGGDPCAGSTCPNDQMPTPAEVTTCKMTLDANKNATCYSLVVSYLGCAAQNRVCSSGGTTDVTLSSTKVTNNCKQQFDAAQTCCASNPTSTVCL